ncbi:hypothetical protein ACSSS7_007380 [Eimeria intestinalis]
MLEGDSLVAGLVASPSSSVIFASHVEEKPHDDPTSPLPLLTAAEGPPGSPAERLPKALRGHPYQSRPLISRPSAARGVSLLLVYSGAAAVAFLLALCFRTLRPKGGGPLGGPLSRLLAGQHPWGPYDGEEDDVFLSHTLEECLDVEAELGLQSLPSVPQPHSEEQAISNIMWGLREEASLFEYEKERAQQHAQWPPQGSQPPAAWPTYPGLVAGEEEYQWPQPQAWGSHEGHISPFVPPTLPPTPSAQTSYGSPPFPQLMSLLQTPFGVSPAAAAAAPTAPQAWPLQAPDLQGVGGPLGALASPGPSAGGLSRFAASPILLSLLQQQEPSSSQEAAALGDSDTLTASSTEAESDSQSPPIKKHKGDYGVAEDGAQSREAPRKKAQRADWPKGVPHKTTEPTPSKREPRKRDRSSTSASRAFGRVSSSRAAGAPISEEETPSTSGVSAPKSSASAQTSSPSSASGLTEGSISVTLMSGETISFAHPPIPTPPGTPAHYRLPHVPLEAIRTMFRIEHALMGRVKRNAWPHLSVLRRLFLQPSLTSADVEEMVERSQYLVRHMLTKYRYPVSGIDSSRAKERLALRFLGFEAIVNVVQLLGPAMNPGEWFPQLVAAVPTNYESPSQINSPNAFMNAHLTELLVKGLQDLTRGRRPSLELTIEAKTLLFASDISPRNIPPWARTSWTRMLENPGAEEGSSTEETLSDED